MSVSAQGGTLAVVEHGVRPQARSPNKPRGLGKSERLETSRPMSTSPAINGRRLSVQRQAYPEVLLFPRTVPARIIHANLGLTGTRLGPDCAAAPAPANGRGVSGAGT